MNNILYFCEQLEISIWQHCYNCFVLWCVSGLKAPLAFVWHEERFYTAGPVLRNSAGGLADGKPWGYKRSNRNGLPCRLA